MLGGWPPVCRPAAYPLPRLQRRPARLRGLGLQPSEADRVAAALSSRGYGARSEGDLLLVQADGPMNWLESLEARWQAGGPS